MSPTSSSTTSPYGDATLATGLDARVGAVSSITAAYIAQLLTIGVADALPAGEAGAGLSIRQHPGGDEHTRSSKYATRAESGVPPDLSTPARITDWRILLWREIVMTVVIAPVGRRDFLAAGCATAGVVAVGPSCRPAAFSAARAGRARAEGYDMMPMSEEPRVLLAIDAGGLAHACDRVSCQGRMPRCYGASTGGRHGGRADRALAALTEAESGCPWQLPHSDRTTCAGTAGGRRRGVPPPWGPWQRALPSRRPSTPGVDILAMATPRPSSLPDGLAAGTERSSPASGTSSLSGKVDGWDG